MSESLPTPSSQTSPSQSQTPQTKPQTISQPIPTTPVQTSPPPKATPKSNIKALPTVRDHTSDQLGPENDEYLPREYDEAGEKKVDEFGFLTGTRLYRCRTFTVPGRGRKLFMLATECARVLTYRDSYLLFNKNRSLYKIIATQKEKEDLINQDILPFSYRSRQIAIVTARSMFRQFGSRVIDNGRRVRDDYWESKAKKQGFTEDDPAGEKRPGASRAKEAAAAESHLNLRHTFAQGDIVYSDAPGFDGMQPPALHAGMGGMGASHAQLPMVNLAGEDIRFKDVHRPRQEMAGPPYHDRTQPSSETEIMNQAAHTADFNKVLGQQRDFRSKMLGDYWNRPHDPPVSTPLSQPAEPVSEAIKQSSSPRFGSIDAATPQPNMLPHQRQHALQQHMNPPPFPHQQTIMQSPLHQPQMQPNPIRDPSVYHQQPHITRNPSGMSMPPGPSQPTPYGGYSNPNPSQPQPQMWQQPQQSPALGRMHTPHYSPSMGQPQLGQQIASPAPGQHQPSPSPHPPTSMHPPQMLHQSSAGSLGGQQIYGGVQGLPGQGGFPGMTQRPMYNIGGSTQHGAPYMPQTSPGWPTGNPGTGGWSGY
jgi:hypothetical protein